MWKSGVLGGRDALDQITAVDTSAADSWFRSRRGPVSSSSTTYLDVVEVCVDDLEGSKTGEEKCNPDVPRK